MASPSGRITDISSHEGLDLDTQQLSSALARPNHLSPYSFWHGHIPFAHYIVASLRPQRIVEFGVEHGDSLFAFADAARWNGIQAEIIGCDLWSGDQHVGKQDEWIYQRVAQIAQTYGDSVTLRRMRTTDFATELDDGSVDLLHIDASHSYVDALADFESMRSKLSSRAIVLFHDITVYAERYGVWRLWQDLTEKYPHLTFSHSCGLGVLAFGSELPSQLADQVNSNDDEKLALARLFSHLGRRVSLEYDAVSQREAVMRMNSFPPPADLRPSNLLTRCLDLARW
ncbi:class I SAM-dependent methyltransferase [Mesorhizobium sp. M0053]|uniref:class I SAM-dependent methyltransferase n=1 Tax=Mesorhizobium sp. M0053 TaxID=2956864 RepID=UPI00333AF862